MTSGTIQSPAKGQPMTAQWGTDVACRLNALGSFATPGTLFSEGAGGAGTTPLPKNLRDRKTKPQPVELHPWKVFGLTMGDPDTEDTPEENRFKIYSPLGPSAYGGCIFVGSEAIQVGGITQRTVEGEDGSYYSFDGESAITPGSGCHTLFIVIYLKESENSDSEDPEFEFAAQMVTDPDAFQQESSDVKAVYGIVPVATVHVEYGSNDMPVGIVDSQSLKNDVIYVSEYYL